MEYIWKLGVGFHLLQTVVSTYISGIHLETRSWIPFTQDSSWFLHFWNLLGIIWKPGVGVQLLKTGVSSKI